MRRQLGSADSRLQHGDLTVDLASKRVSWKGLSVEVTAREFQLLEILLGHRGEVVSREQLWEHCYDFASETVSNVLEVLIGRLRRKLAAVGCEDLILTRRGLGYEIPVS